MNVLIIGGSTGIGAALIHSLNQEGHKTISINRSGETFAHTSFKCDILNEDLPSVDDSIDSIVYLPGSIQLKPFKNIKKEDFILDWEINFFGAVKVIQNYLPKLNSSENPSIVLFSTVAVQTGMPFHASIASAKGAVEGLTKSLAAELAPKIRVNCIAPSLTATPLAARLIDNETKLKSATERHPLKQVGDAADIASLASWLISEKSKFVTGQLFKMDGGLSAIR